MQLYIGIGMIVVGILAAVIGFTNVVPHIGGSGVGFVFLGLLVVGLSFVPGPEFEEEVEPKMPFAARLMNIFVAPGDVFRNIRFHPTWLGVLLATAIVSGGYNFAFYEKLTPKRIANYTVDKIAESGFVPAEQVVEVRKQTVEQASSIPARIGSVFSGFAGQAFFAAFIGLIFFLTVLVTGGKINYLQALSVASFSLFPFIFIQKLFSMVILFLKDPVEIHPIIGQGSLLPDNLGFLMSAGDSPVLYSLLSYLSLLGFYWLWLNAYGLSKGGTRVSTTSGWVAALVIWLLGLGVTVLSALFFGKFLS